MSTRLHPAAKNREHTSIWFRQKPGCQGRNRRCPHPRDESSIHRSQRLSGIGSKQLNDSLMGRLLANRILGKDGDEFGTQEAAVKGRHQAKECLVSGNWNDLTGQEARPAEYSIKAA